MTKCYIASPFFNKEQVGEVDMIKSILEALKVEVFSPKDFLICKPDASEKERRMVFQKNVEEIRNSDFIICNTNNKDMGSVFEAGVAYEANIPIIYFNQTLKGYFNLMLGCSSMKVTTSYAELTVGVQRFIKEGRFYEEYTGGIE